MNRPPCDRLSGLYAISGRAIDTALPITDGVTCRSWVGAVVVRVRWYVRRVVSSVPGRVVDAGRVLLAWRRTWPVSAALALLVLFSVGTQDAMAFVGTKAPQHLPSPRTPEQRSGSADGGSGRVGADATRAKGSGERGKPHTPGQGELAPYADVRDLGAGRRIPQVPPAKGRTVQPPASVQPTRTAGRSGSVTSGSGGRTTVPGPAAEGVEDVAARTESTSVFANADGTRTVRVYPRPVHYRKADGSWGDIDTDLSSTPEGRWTEKANAQQATFAARADDTALIDWTVDSGHRVSYGLRGAAAVRGAVSGDELTYPGARPGADVVYNGMAQGVKESLVLHDSSAPTTWFFPLRLTGLTANLGSGGQVQFRDEKGVVRLSIPAGFMEDSRIDPASGDGARSSGVTYTLVTEGGSQVLRMDLDQAWLHDSARVFPVTVDPTTTTSINVGKSTYVQNTSNANYSSDSVLRMGSYDGGTDQFNTYLYFPAATNLGLNYVESVSLNLDNTHSFECSPHDVNVSQITSAWDPSSIHTFPGLSIGQRLGTRSFSHGDTCSGGAKWDYVDLGHTHADAGSQLVESWAHGGANYGLAVHTDQWNSYNWKKFASVNTAYPPYLSIVYSDWAASYSVAGTYTPPTSATAGSQQVTMTNLAANWWNSTSMQLKARIFDGNWAEQAVGTQAVGVSGLVQTGQSVTVNGIIPPLPAGRSYILCWDGYVGGTTSLHDSYGVPFGTCTWVSASNVPPQVDTVEPLGNTVVGTLLPQLYATGHDPDNYPGSGLQYEFQVNDGSNVLVDSGWVATQSWAVPTGLLAWNRTYTYTVRVFDGQASSQWSTPAAFTTTVQQPLITSKLARSADDTGSGRSFDAQVGNYSTSATDASVKAVGPALAVARSYNSLDPRTSTLFGSGWSSLYDMGVVPDGDSSGSVVVTTAAGRAERFGRNDFQLGQLAGIGDQTGDGIGDAVAVDTSTGKLWLFPGPGYSQAERKLMGEGWNGVSQITGADATGDGVGDLYGVVTGDGSLRLYPGRAGGGFGEPVTVGASGWNGMTGLAVTPPLAADGRKDLLAVEKSSGYLYAFPIAANGTLGSSTSLGYGWNGIGELIGGDFNHDGKGDVVGVQTGTGALLEYPGTGNATLGTSTLAAPVQIGTGWTAMRDLATVNGLAGDAGTDILAVDRASGVQYVYHSGSAWSGPSRTTTGMALYTSPSGEYETLATDAAGGWILADKTGTVYRFNQQAGSGGGYLLSRITDRQQHSQVLHYTGGKLDTVTDEVSGRALHLTWTADGRHAASVYTDPAVGTDWNTAQTWTYTYDTVNPDQLATVCTPPAGTNTTRPCTAYTYTPGSHLRSTVLDAGPSSYWRLNDAAGAATAASEVIENQASDKGTYTGVTLGSASGPLAGSATKAATFDGSTSSVTLPNASLRNSYLAVGLWFRTTSPGVLVGYQNTALNASPSHASSPLYIGTDGKLRGEFYGPAIGFNPLTSTTAVNDGAWHFAVLSGAGDTQTLYLDNQKVGTLAGAIDHLDDDFTYLGAGYTRGIPWPVPPTAGADGNNHFSGQIAEAALYPHPLGAPAVAAQWTAGRNASAELTKLALPSGKTKLAVTYDAVNDRASQVTDANGGVWTLNTPTVSGSEQAYRSAVLGSRPAGYWRLAEGAASQASNMITVPRAKPNNGTYSNVTLGAAGPMSGSAGSATFDGATSWAELPAAYAPASGPGALGVWFKTTSPGVLISYQSFPIGSAPTAADDWNPALYVGTDNKLHGQFWTGSTTNTLASAKNVTDGAWHLAVLAADSPTTQTLYLDGDSAAGPLNAQITPNGQAHVYVGAGTLSSGWPAAPTTADGHFKGQIADVMAFDHGFAYTTTVHDLYTQAATGGAAVHDAAVIDAHPTGYWPLDDTTGSQAAERLSSAALAQNQGTYRNVTLGTPGPYTTGGTTAATFNGTTSLVQLPATAAPRIGNTAAVEVWFKTATAGVLYGQQSFALGTTPGAADKSNPVLYVGTDNKLHGQIWTGSAANTAVSDKTVTDNTWHMATLVAAYTGSTITQQLYVDGAASGAPITGTPGYAGDTYAYLGAGTVTAASPNAPADTSGHFNGSIADFAYFPTSLSASVVAAHWTAATGAPAQAVSQSANLRAQVTLANPSGYWRLDEHAGATVAQDQLGAALPNQEHGTYTDVTLNTAGPAGAWDGTAATFNGTTSSLRLPDTAAPVKGPDSIELWFRTTKAGVLYGYQTFPLGAAHTAGKDRWNPALYVGTDGRLYGALWTGDAANALVSSRTVTDNTWHHAVIAGDDSGQTLYLDGAQSATSTTARQIYYNGAPYVYVGAGTADDGWPNHPTSPDGRFTGSIAGVAFYPGRLDADTVNAHYKAMGTAATPTKSTYSSVTAPGGYVMSWRHDTRTGQLVLSGDLTGANTRYSYDTHGYLYSVTDPDGHTTTTGHDERGNVVSTTSCTTAADCHTGYAEYYLDPINPFDPRNDHLVSKADARSAGPDDATYTSRYTYNSSGDLATTTLPATPDFPNGRSTSTSYTTGAEAAVGGSGTQPAALVATTTGLGGTTATAAYDRFGNLTRATSPSGLTTSYTYDNLGRMKTRTTTCADCGPGQSSTTTAYDWDGRSSLLRQTDPAVTDAVTGVVHTRQTRTEYDQDGNPVSRTAADLTGNDTSRTTTWTYNTTNSLLARTTDPSGHATSYTYDAYGNTTSMTDAAGTTWTYTWDAMRRPLRSGIGNYKGSPTSPVPQRSQLLESRAYDPAGRLATVTDAMGRTTHTYYYDDNTVAEVDLDGFHDADGTQRTMVVQQNRYDAAGQLVQQVTGGGRTTLTSAYDAAGRVSSRTLDPGGLNRTTSYGYDAENHPVSVTATGGGLSRHIDSTYDAAGSLLTQTVRGAAAGDATTSYTYDQLGRSVTTVTPDGNATGADRSAFTSTQAYDALDRPTVATGPLVNAESFVPGTRSTTPLATRPVTTVGYNTFDEATSVQDPRGVVTTATYDASGQQTAVTNSAYTDPRTGSTTTPTVTTAYDVLGRVTGTTTDPGGLNLTTGSTYDQLGRIVEQRGPAVGGSTPTSQFSYDLDGELLSSTSPTGSRTEATYDDAGRRITATQVERFPVPTALTTTFGWDDAGNQITSTQPNGGVTKALYNAAGETLRVTDPAGLVTSTDHDGLGRPSRTTRPDGTALSTAYDTAGNAVGDSLIDTNGAVTGTAYTTYDLEGRIVAATDRVATAAEAPAHTTSFTYDPAGNLVKQVEPVAAGSTVTSTFGYDVAGNRTRFTNGKGVPVYSTYNVLGQAESTVEPPTATAPSLADGTFTTSYDAAGRAVALTEPGGVVRQRTFDALGRMTQETASGAEAATPTRTLGYDADGRLTSAGTPTGSNTYAYNDRGLLLTSAGPGGSSAYTYDNDGNMTGRTDAAGTASFGYTTADQLKTAVDPLTGRTLTFGYDSGGRLQTQQYGTGGANRTYTYDTLGRLAQDTVKNPGGTTLSSIGYGYDQNGRLTAKTTTGTAGATANHYTYDLAGRLTSWDNGTSVTAYTWDAAGNRTGAGSTTSTYDDRNELLDDGSKAYTYSARGTLSSSTLRGAQTATVRFDGFGRMVQDGPVTRAYDSLDRLTQSGSSSFQYDGGSNNAVSDGSTVYSRLPGGGLMAGAGTGATPAARLLLTDSHSDVVAGLDPTTSTLTGSTAYDPFGKPVAASGTTASVGYQSGWTDPTTGDVDMAARWYRPGSGSFDSRDSLTLDPSPSIRGNRFGYTGGDPLDATDPSGHCWFPGCNRVGTALKKTGNTWLNLMKAEGAGLKKAGGMWLDLMKAEGHIAQKVLTWEFDVFWGTSNSIGSNECCYDSGSSFISPGWLSYRLVHLSPK